MCLAVILQTTNITLAMQVGISSHNNDRLMLKASSPFYIAISQAQRQSLK